MQPPAKRMRILRSVDVDESDPDYIKAKQQQQLKFKGRLESIFAKYENMHESMSDEIDMRENKIVVDRGHLRRIVRQVNRRETVLLDTLGLSAREGSEECAESEDEGDSEDELAPTQPPKPTSGADKDSQATPATDTTKKITSLQTPDTRTATGIQPSLPQATPIMNPVANYMQYVQFAQTPEGQQAQTSFCAAIAQTINQAVQQAVVLTSTVLQGKPSAVVPLVNAITAGTPSAGTADVVAPATDPKWFFPALSAGLSRVGANPSSPISQPVSSKTLGPSIAVDEEQEESEHHVPVSSPPAPSTAVLSSESFQKRVRQTSPRTSAPGPKKGRKVKYNFTTEDDIYISKQKVVYKRSMADIKSTRAKWQEWPISVFQNHWYKGLRDKNLHLQTATDMGNIKDAIELPHHLPTPSSSTHDDGTAEPNRSNPPSADIRFDDDERDLLSLAEGNIEGSPLPVTIDDDEICIPDDTEEILPSIEMADYVDESSLQQGLLEGSPAEDVPVSHPPQENVHIKTEEDLSLPRSTVELAILVHDQRPRSTSLDLITSENIQSTPHAPGTPHIKREDRVPPTSGLLFRTPQQSRSELPSSGIKSASGLSRKEYLKQVKQSWTKKSSPGPRSLTKRKSFNVLPRKRAWDVVDGESDDELA